MTHSDAPSPATDDRNHLAGELSPYLLQHADNPVHWYPWGDAAFARAATSDRPIFLSIGYATCHWCHVMEHESFEDPAVARLMNECFVNIKVDREERPDVDQVYMAVCQLLSGSGGWPLTIIMTPDKRPFFVATYLPRESRFGRMGMLDLIPQVQRMWRERRTEVEQSAEQIVARLRSTDGPAAATGPTPSDLETKAVRQLAGRFDAEHGGFGSAPKFPSPHNLIFLTRHARRHGEPSVMAMVTRTLDAMRRGGLYDQLGFGFHRYATDREWLLPHFEKMLYDQAMLTLAYAEAAAATAEADYRRVVAEVFSYVRRDLSSPQGGFYSAEDADSEGEEGKFYLWTLAELAEGLSAEDAALAVELWQLLPHGNFADEASGQPSGANILHLGDSHAAAARRAGLPDEVFAARLEGIRQTLLLTRNRRVRPLLDDKILSDWNGLMIAAFARAAALLDDDASADTARRAADFVWRELRDGDGRLLHRFRAGRASIAGFLDDHAFMVWGLLELYEATCEARWLDRAWTLNQACVELFWDHEHGGFFFTASDAEELLLRQQEVYDGAIPSGNSVAFANLVRLHRLTGDAELATLAGRCESRFARQLALAPSAHSHFVDALAVARSGLELVIVGDPGAAHTRALLAAYRERYLPWALLHLLPPGAAGARLRELVPHAAACQLVDGRAAAYLCRDFSCALPITEPAELALALDDAAATTQARHADS